MPEAPERPGLHERATTLLSVALVPLPSGVMPVMKSVSGVPFGQRQIGQ